MLKNALKKPCSIADIKGFKEVSLLEWDGRLASILFLAGCNLRCPFCHAKPLVMEPKKIKTIPFKEIEAFLRRKKGWVDGVVITGGEPTLCNGLFDLLDKVRALGFATMIETNGTMPQVIKELLHTKRLDCITMDIKAPLDNSGKPYYKATAKKINIKDIKDSIDTIMSSGIEYEFRTTVVPTILDKNDIIEIAKSIKGARKLSLQQFFPKNTLDPEFTKIKPYTREFLEEMAQAAGEFVDEIVIKNE